MHHSSRERERELSLLAQGRGFYRHGVQVECFVDDFKAYSLGGRPFVQSSSLGTGRSCKPYRSHTLTLPKTYVTKRGQMVLFTAPEDMIQGQSCSVHQKEIISKKTVQELKTTRSFANSAMTYGQADAQIYDKSDFEKWKGPEAKGAWPEMKGAWQDEREVKAGHFTDVYLRSLQKATTGAHSKPHDELTVVEDLEEKDFDLDTGNKKALGEDLQMDVESHLIPECDSGLGQSIGPSPSGRLSNHSQHSELSTVISIPHGSMSEVEEMRSPLVEMSELMREAGSLEEEDGGLAALKQELGFYKVKGAWSATDPKKLAKTGKKRQHPKSTSSNKSGADTASNISASSKPKTKKSNKVAGNKASALENLSSSKVDQLRSGHPKPSKVKKRRGKKQLLSQEGENVDPMVIEGDIQENIPKEDVQTAVQGHVTEEQDHVTGNRRGLGGGVPLEVTAVQLGMGEREEYPVRSRRPSRAEERKLEIERKRLEKREMERLRKQEEEEKQRLKEEKEVEIQSAQDLGCSDQLDDTADDAIEPSSPEPPSPPPVGINQQQLRDALERAKLRENTLLLTLKMESSDRLLTDEIRSVEEAVERARRAAEELEKKREEEERQRHEEEERLRAEEERKRLEEEAIQDALDKRAQSIQTRSARLKSECVKAADVERKTKRYRDTVAPSIMFSYFSYVPPPGNRKKSEPRAPKRGQRPQTIRSK